jgi:putrescine aminotransferase
VTEPRRLRQLDVAHHLNPFCDYELKRSEGGSRIIERASGVRIFDTDGLELLDGMSGLWCVQVGYGRDELVQAATRQMTKLPYYNSFFKTTTPPTVELATVLSQLTPDGLDRVFFGSSGSEAIDTMIRLVRWYWHLLGKSEKAHFIGRRQAYHGSTLAGASLGGLSFMQEGFGLPLPGFHHVMPPYSFELAKEGESPDAFGIRAARDLEDKILEIGPDKVAAFVGEPVMGAGGLIIPPSTYWPEVSRICKEHDVLLVADEVICGFGRTGNWFGSDTYQISPDLMTVAKGITSGYLPLSAVMVGDAVADAIEHHGGEFAHGYTYSGHPTACAVALANLELLNEGGIVSRCRSEIAPYFQEQVRKLDGHPMVGEVRGVGMLAGIELVDPASGKRWDANAKVGTRTRDACMQNGVVSRAIGDTMVLAPPLVTEPVDLDAMVARLHRSIDETWRDLQR